MKSVAPWFAMLLLCASSVRSQTSDQLTTAQSAATLTNAQACKHQSISFEATVTYYRPYERNLFVQQGTAAIYVHPSHMYQFVPGDRVGVRGTVHESFRPYIENAELTFLGHGPLPAPARPTFEQMIRAETDSRLVTVRAVIEVADLVPNSQAPVSPLNSASCWMAAMPTSRSIAMTHPASEFFSMPKSNSPAFSPASSITKCS